MEIVERAGDPLVFPGLIKVLEASFFPGLAGRREGAPYGLESWVSAGMAVKLKRVHLNNPKFYLGFPV